MKRLTDSGMLHSLQGQSFEALASLCNDSNKLQPWEFRVAPQAAYTIGEAAQTVAAQVGCSARELARQFKTHAHKVEEELVVLFDVPEAQMVVVIPVGWWTCLEDAQRVLH